jgi:hypothetical protein
MIDATLLLKEIRKRELWPAFLKRQKYSEDQPRDDVGRWTDTGGSGGRTSGKITSIKDAIERLGNGQGIQFERPEQVVTLLHKLRAVVKEAAARGEKAKVYDLCKVYVKGTNLFCEHNVKIPRSEMPQLKGFPAKGSTADRLYPKDKNGKVDLTFPYLSELGKHGIGVEKVTVPATHLRAAQNQIDGAKVAKILHEYERDGVPDRSFYVSKDHYIVDGHHHYAAQVALQLEKTSTVRMSVYRVNEKILPLLQRTKDYTTRMGVGAQAIGKAWKYSEDQPRDDIGRWTDGGGGGTEGEGAGLPPNVTVGDQTVREVLEGQGNWKLTVESTTDTYEGTQYHMRIEPRGNQPGYTQSTDRRGDKIWYDPTVSHLEKDSYTGHMEPMVNDSERERFTIPATAEAGVLFRGMSYKEYQAAKANGYVQSQGQYNMTTQESQTFFSTNPAQAASYAAGFAPWHQSPTGSHPAIVLAVKTNNPVLSTVGATEIGLGGRVPWSEVQAVYQGKPWQMKVGHLDLLPTGRTDVTHREGSRSSPASSVLWQKHTPDPIKAFAFAPPAWLIAKSYPALVRLAEQLEPSLREAFLEAVNSLRSAVDLERLALAIQSNSLNAVQIEVKLAQFAEKFGDLAPVLKSGFHVGANVGLRQLAEEASISMRFDVVNPAAVSYAQNHVAQIVRPFVDDAKEVIAEIVGRAVNGEFTYASAAREIRDTIGLDPRRYEALENYKQGLIDDGKEGDQLERMVARKETSLLKARSETIARTEIMRAANAGQREAWQEAARQGLLRRDEWNRVWKTTDDERLCDECGPMDEETVAFDGEFQGGDPPLHPNCRCTVRLEQP